MSSVEIEYCVPCGFRDRAVDLAEQILTRSEGELDELDLVMGAHGVFRVSVDGETVFDKEEHAYDADEIAASVADAL